VENLGQGVLKSGSSVIGLKNAMTFGHITVALLLLAWVDLAQGASPGNAPALPITGARVVNVSTEPQLQTAMVNLQSGDTILLADGTYNLTSKLYINGRNSVTIRGAAGITNVVLVTDRNLLLRARPYLGAARVITPSVRSARWKTGQNCTLTPQTARTRVVSTMLRESENQFSLPRAALSTRSAQKQIHINSYR
jgi:hypothetical protein